VPDFGKNTMTPARKRVELTRSQVAERLICWEGRPLSLGEYPQFRATYDGIYKRTVLKTSRQVGKSIKLMADLLIDSVANPYFKSLFVTPSEEQTQRFSTLRLGKAIHYSPHIRDNFIDSSLPNRVLTRSFTNGSEIVLTYADEDADRVRGNSADHVLMDETQDILLDAVAPEIKECLSQSRVRRESYCGTPKTLENGIEHLWKNSTQTEWAIKCDGCGKFSIILSETQLGKFGPICGHCSSYLNPRNGLWVNTNPNKDVRYQGFHISRPTMLRGVAAAWPEGPARDEAKEEWKDILDKLEGPTAYSLPKFRNEVLGVSDSVGRRLVTEEVLLSAADGPVMSDKPTPELMQGITRVAAGIDWSGGGKDGHSFTVLVIIGRMPSGKIRLLYFKIFPGLHPVDENTEIRRIIKNYDANNQVLVGGDAGEGNMNMDMLRTTLVNPERVLKFRYAGPQTKHYVSWDQARNCYIVNRTVAIDSCMMAFLRREFQFPREPQGYVKAAFKHILAEYEEVTSENAGGAKFWRHAPTDPDDFLHALVFARIAIQTAIGEINLGSSPPG